ncbi:tetratricopeptide repeat protein [Rhodanobacter sp. L36]|uniref:tetratricopeptide repeat protein n=1 Tax=Rhodanobacter sp. L36 TaxID=1747221 RepID=UPI00131E9053|nr:tetratricopeptide repeat protein [Rhodanobacter sp. L36]
MKIFAELKRRNVLRAGVLYAGAVWALAQGIAQLGPSLGLPDWTTRWFLVAAVIGFPLWLTFAWFYEFTPSGLKRESDIASDDSTAHSNGRKLDFWIIGVLAAAVVLLLTDRFVVRPNTGVASPSNPSIAVLPLSNESGDPAQQYFSDGLSEDLINALSQFNGLKVISRNSSFQFRDSKDDAKAIGAKLGVAHLLEGSVRRAGDEVRISAELVNADDGSTLWSQQYDRPYADLFKLQDEITQAVADELKTRLLADDHAAQADRPRSGNLAAYNAYLQGKFYFARGTEVDWRKAIDSYTTATRLDPDYALAWSELSAAWAGVAGGYLGGTQAQQAYAQSRAAVTTALALQPNLAAAHAAHGHLLIWADFDLAGAQIEYRRALQLTPTDGVALFNLGFLQATLGQPEQAVALTRRALVTNPLNADFHVSLGGYLSGLGRPDEAEPAVRKAIELQPAAVTFHVTLTTIEIQRGDAKAALTAARQEPPGDWQDVALALAQQVGGDHTAADAALKNLIDKDATQAPYQIADVYALRRDADHTFAWLDRAWAVRDPGVAGLLVDPYILRYRDDPRFAAFCKKVGLPITTEAKALP